MILLVAFCDLFFFCLKQNPGSKVGFFVCLFCVPVYQEFDHLLEEQSPIESYIEWLDSMVDRCVVKVGKEDWVTDVHYELYSDNTFLEKIKAITTTTTTKKMELVMSRTKAVVGQISPVFMENCLHSGFCFILLFLFYSKRRYSKMNKVELSNQINILGIWRDEFRVILIV